MTGTAAVSPKYQFKDALGVPLVGGTLDVYLAGTTNRTTTWQDKTQLSANTNPIVLDSRGECVLWVDPLLTYKFVLKNVAGVTQWTVDNISGTAVSATLISYTSAGTGAVARTVQQKLQEIVTPYDFGAVDDKAVDSSAALQAFFTYINTHPSVKAVCEGSFGLATSLTFDPNQLYLTVTRVIEWNALFWDISVSGLSQLITFKNCRDHAFTGYIAGYGQGNSNYATRATLDIFVFDQYMSNTNIQKMSANYALRWGFRIENFNSQIPINQIQTGYCGTANDAGNRLEYQITAITNSGAASNINQRSLVTLSSNLPTHVTADHAMIVFQIRVAGVITGYTAHMIKTIPGTNQVSIWPWLDPAMVNEYVYLAYGGAVYMNGSDTSVCDINYLDAYHSGIAIWNKPLYPARIGSLTAQNGAIACVVGGDLGNAVEGGSIGHLYAEANYLDVVGLSATAQQGYTIHQMVGGTLDNKLFACCNADALYRYLEPLYVRILNRYNKTAVDTLGTIYPNSTATLQPDKDSTMPMLVMIRDTKTVTLTSNYTMARLNGGTGYLLMALGTGTKNQPTGTWTFACEADWKINTGVTGASAAFTNFVGPTLFSIHADYFAATKNWIVKVVGPQILLGSFVYNPASLAAGAAVSQSVTVTGAVMGDKVTAISHDGILAGVILNGQVTAADTVTATFMNTTTGALDCGNGTIRVEVTKA